ncbi:MAG: HK97 family phage prohead protease [Elusimicrobia bacterium]|nr:HK97 family phage prohead protease [Elusimicrobiota bacterium]
MDTAVLEKIPFNFPLDIFKQVEVEGEFHVRGYASTSDLDAQNDLILPEALQEASEDLMRNSTVLLNHQLDRAIGRVTEAQWDGHGLLIDVLISKTEPEVIEKVREGILNKFSIRGQILEKEKKYVPKLDRMVNVIRRLSLVEVSLVSVPANPEARAIGWYIKKALEQTPEKQGGESMSQEQVVKEEAPPANPPAPEAPKPAETPAPEAKAPEVPPAPETAKEAEVAPPPAPPAPAAATSAAPETPAAPPAPQEEVQKNLVNMLRAQLEPVFMVLEKIMALGGPATLLAQQAKAMLKAMVGDTYPFPAAADAGKTMEPEQVEQRIAAEVKKQVEAEVKKQVEALLKEAPVARKGLVPDEPKPEGEDALKAFQKLPPEGKLKVALALQQ